MPQSLVQIYLHVVYSTKHREPFLGDPAVREQMHSYLAGICGNLDSPALIIGGVADHVHLLCRLGKNIKVPDLLQEMKRGSSIGIKEVVPALSSFHWQGGYGAFSISPSHVAGLTQYIQGQEEHHRHVSFQDEFRELCRKYGVELDERYAWD
jgi:REP element-mobilizing transposase RayT